MIDRKRKMNMQRRLPLLLVSIYLCFSVTAADILEDLGNFPICAQACYTEALAQCTPKCNLTDFTCICKCSTFQDNVKSCVSTSCAASHLQEVIGLITTNCKVLDPITTTTSGSTSKTTTRKTTTSKTATSKSTMSKTTSTSLPTSGSTTLGITTRRLPPDTSISPGVFPPTGSATSYNWTTTIYTGPSSKPTGLGDTPPGGGPASVIGPACVPIHGQPNSSYPSSTNWTNGIIFENGTWRNSSCFAANGTAGAGYEQVGVNEAALVRTGSWLAVALCVVMGLMVWLG